MKKQEADLMKPIPAPGKCGPSKSENTTIIGSLEKAKRWFTGENIFVRCYLDDARRDDCTEAQTRAKAKQVWLEKPKDEKRL